MESGTNVFLKKGAKIVTSAEDIIQNYAFLPCNKNIISKNINKKNKGNCNKNEKDLSSDINLFEANNINKKYLDVYNALIGPPISINQICNTLNKPVNEVTNALFMLELDGLIEKTQYGYQIK